MVSRVQVFGIRATARTLSSILGIALEAGKENLGYSDMMALRKKRAAKTRNEAKTEKDDLSVERVKLKADPFVAEK